MKKNALQQQDTIQSVVISGLRLSAPDNKRPGSYFKTNKKKIMERKILHFMKWKKASLLAVLLVMGFLVSAQTSYYVDNTNGLDTYDGTRWDHTTGNIGAFKTIDKALAAAVAAPAGSTTNIYVKQGTYAMATTAYTLTNKSILLQGGFPTAATGADISGYAAANTTTMQYSGAPSPASISVNNSGAGPYTVAIKGFTQQGLTGNDFFDAITGPQSNCAFSFTDMIHGAGAQSQTYDLENLNASNSIGFNNVSFNGLTQTGTNGTAITVVNSAVAPSLITCTFNNNKAASGVIYLSQISASPIASIASDCVFTNNAAASNGGVFYLDQNTGSFVLANIATPITGNSAGSLGGVVYYSANYTGTTNISNTTFTTNTAGYKGGVFYQGTGATTAAAFIVNNSNFLTNAALPNGSGSEGGAICLDGNTPLTIKKSTFSNNSVNYHGGAIYVSSNSTSLVSIDSTTFSGNNSSGAIAGSQGGAIHLDGNTPLTITNGVFDSNSADYQGGAISVPSSTSAAVSIQNTSFTSNTATGGSIAGSKGGALFLGTGPLTVSGSNFCANAASYQGGAILLNGNATIDNSVFNSNVSQGGGAITTNGSATISVSNSTAYNNQAAAGTGGGNGGFYYGGSGTATFTNDVFLSNQAAQSGGAAYSTSSLLVSNSNFTTNFAANGGALNTTGSVDIGNSIFDGNHSSSNGGAVYTATVTAITASIFRNNYNNNNAVNITASGSDVFVSGAHTYPLTASSMQQSPLTAYTSGATSGSNSNGNAATFANTVAPSGCTSTPLVTPTAFNYFVDNTNGNDANDGSQWNQGSGTTGAFKTIDKALAAAVAAGTGSNVNIYVKQGTYAMAATPYTLTNQSILLQGGFPAAATGTDISGYAAANTTTMQYSGAPSPASISVNNSGAGPYTVAIKGFTETGLTGNDFFDAITATEKNTAFTFTDMTHNGGAQNQTYDFQNTDATNSIAFTNCTFNALTNTTTNGTGISLINSAVTMDITNCVFTNNKANGGIIYTNGTVGTITVDGSSFTGNITAAGGVAYLDGDVPFHATNSIFKFNTGSGNGGVIYTTSNVDMTFGDCVLDSNVTSGSGGALCLNSNTKLTATNTSFSFNKGSGNGGGAIYTTSTSLMSFDHCALDSNTSTGAGGAICLNGDTPLTATNTSFSFNKGSNNGGGAIYDAGSAAVSLGSCVLTNNTTTGAGGALCLNGNMPFTATATTFCSNTAASSGGGIYSSSSMSASIDNCILNNNIASGNSGGAIIFNGNSSVMLSNSTLYNNSAAVNGGGISFNTGNTLTCSNDVFMNNTSPSGGAILFNVGNAFTVDACNFTKNFSSSSTPGGGAILHYTSGVMTVKGGSIFDANYTNAAQGGAIYSNVSGDVIDYSTFRDNYPSNNPANSTAIEADVASTSNTIVITNSRVQHAPLSDYGTGNHTGTTTDGNAAIFAATVAPTGCATTPLILPVSLVSFTGTVTNCAAKLSWTTATEINSSYYDVLVSTNGTTFTSVAHVASKNNASGAAYTYTDNSLSSGTSYYRLKMVDKDGRFAESNIINLTSNCAAGIVVTVRPNPAVSSVTVTGIATGSHVTVYDITGKKLTTVTATGSSQALNVSGYARGTYIISVQTANGKISNVKLVKE